MKTIRVLSLGLILSYSILSGQAANLQPAATDTIIKPDSMNLAIIIIDFMSYQFESVNVSYYAKCNDNCDADSLPFKMYCDYWWDFAHVTFSYKFDNSLLFRGGITWMGAGHIEYPVTFSPAQNWPYAANAVAMPADAEYYNTTIAGNFCSWDEYKQRAATAWHSIHSLELTNLFAGQPFRVGLYGYSRTEGLFDPYNADWIIFLYRGNNQPESGGTISGEPAFRLFPNPGNGKFSFDQSSHLQKIEVYNLFGEKLREITTLGGKNIDICYLPEGMYLIKAFQGSGAKLQKVAIIH